MRFLDDVLVRRPLRLLAILVLGASVLTPAAAQGAADPRTDQLETLINRARVARGLQPLARVAELDAAADGHSHDMVDHDYLDHTGADGSTPQQRADRAGYHVPPQSGWIVVEVISAISADPAGPLDWWLNQSPEIHRKALLDPRWREMGVGYAAGGEFGNYWTVLVGCRPGVLPKIALDGRTYETTEQCGDAAANAAPSLRVTGDRVAAGSEVEVTWSGLTAPTPRDWLGLYRPDDADGQYLAWTYVSCAWMPLTPRASGWCWMRMPGDLPSGTYDLRLHANDGDQRLASATLAVTRP